MTAVDGLSEALSAEYAAIFGYGVVGARLTKSERAAAVQADAAHRARRDALLQEIEAASATPPAARPAYELPFAVTDRASALKLAVTLEEGTSRAWYRALMATTGDQRKLAVNALSDSAVRATRWRRLAGVAPATVPFPGTAT